MGSQHCTRGQKLQVRFWQSQIYARPETTRGNDKSQNSAGGDKAYAKRQTTLQLNQTTLKFNQEILKMSFTHVVNAESFWMWCNCAESCARLILLMPT